MRPGVVMALLAALVACGGSDPDDAPSQTRAAVDNVRLSQPRAVHRATSLADGTVLITGGCTQPGCAGFDSGRRADLFDVDGGIRAGSSMSTGRASGTATLLGNGRVLVTGGYPGEGLTPTGSAEVFDPDQGRFLAVGDLRTARADHTATLLSDGRVLLCGGFDGSRRPLDTTELFDPVSGEFTDGPRLSAPRAAHVATRVGDTVALVGGTEDTVALATTDLLRDNRWTPGPALRTPRVKHGVAALDDRRVLVVGGATETEGRERLATTEVLDLVLGSVRRGPDLPNGEYKLDGALAVLDDGRVVMPSGSGLAVYDPESGRIDQLSVRTYGARSFRTLTSLGRNRVLVAGGYDDSIRPTDEAVVVKVPDRDRPAA